MSDSKKTNPNSKKGNNRTNSHGNRASNRRKPAPINDSDSGSSMGRFAPDNRRGKPADVVNHNDPSWYNRYPALNSAYANVPFTNPLGAQIPFSDDLIHYMPTGNCKSVAIPALAVASVTPCPSVSKDAYSAVNVASGVFFTTTRYKMAGSGTYDRNILMMYLLGTDSMFIVWAEAVRAYAIAMCYSANNRYFAKTILEALGWDYEDIAYNLPKLRGVINEYAQKIANFNIPGDMSFLKRHIWMFGNLFKDGPSTKSQLYAYKPTNYWVFDEFGRENGATLTAEYRPALQTIDGLTALMEKMFNAMFFSQTMMNCSGDVGKAISPLQSISAIPEFLTAPIQMDPRACMEIQNMTFVGDITVDSNVILADNDINAITYRPAVEFGEMLSTLDPTVFDEVILNVRDDNPTSDDVMKATRGTTLLANKENADGTIDIAVAGTEIGNKMSIFILGQSDTDVQPTAKHYDFVTWMNNNIYTSYNIIALINLLDKFDMHPYIYWFTNSEDQVLRLGFTGDVDNYTILRVETLRKIHEAAVMSEFYSPGMGNMIVT